MDPLRPSRSSGHVRSGSRSRLAAALTAVLVLLAAAAPAAFSAERKLPAFEVKLLNGKLVRSKDLAGKVVVIDFWATWCQPCLGEIEEYNRFQKEYGSKIQFL